MGGGPSTGGSVNPLIVGLIIYSLIILFVGVRAARLNRTLDAYLLADRKLGPWVAGLSYAASTSSAWVRAFSISDSFPYKRN